MKTKSQAIVIDILLLSLLISGCGSEQIFGPTITPSLTITATPTFSVPSLVEGLIQAGCLGRLFFFRDQKKQEASQAQSGAHPKCPAEAYVIRQTGPNQWGGHYRKILDALFQ